MARQLRIVHRTGYRYGDPVNASHNEARMTPRSTREQTVVATRLQISPTAWTHSFEDYWGTPVTAFEISEPHARLDVVATSTVDVATRASSGRHLGWDELADPRLQDDQVEMLTVADHVDPGPELRRIAREEARRAGTPAEAVAALISRVRARVAYVPGSTHVDTRASAVWERGAGVCQDLVHVSLGALRTIGIPARYVSGYVVPSASPVVGEPRTGESHAWLQYWDGDWVGVDPTNDAPPGDLHVEVGVGRDYFDVPPLKGVYSGSDSSELFVAVEITVLG